MSIVLEGNPDYIIFFDDQHVHRYVSSFNVSLSLNGQPNQATITMIYTEAFLNIEYMTDVKIFVKNVFTGTYQMVFDGQIHNRQININSRSKSIVFTAIDNMYWLQNLPVPMLFGTEQELDPVTVLSWLAKGINYSEVSSIVTQGEEAFGYKNLQDTLTIIFNKINEAMSIHAASPTTSSAPDYNTIYSWINLQSKMCVVTDIDPAMRPNDVIDLFYQGAIVDNMYTLLAGMIQQLGYEMYQDIDGLIKLKEPFWHDGILKNYVLDNCIVLDFTEATNWDAQYTRVFATGGLGQEFIQNAASQEQIDINTPAGVLVNNTANTWVTTMQAFNPALTNSYPTGTMPGISPPEEASARQQVVSMAQQAVTNGIWYKSGQCDLSRGGNGTDCAGLVYACYKAAGYTWPRATVVDKVFSQVTQIQNPSDLQLGDLGYSTSNSLVGIYAGAVPAGQVNAGQYEWITVPTTPNAKVTAYYTADEGASSMWDAWGTLVSPATAPVDNGKTLTQLEISAIATATEQLQTYGLSASDAATLASVIPNESSGNPCAVYNCLTQPNKEGKITGEYSVGLFQINIGTDDANLPLVERLSGIPDGPKARAQCADWLMVPANNTRVAASLWQSSGEQPWAADFGNGSGSGAGSGYNISSSIYAPVGNTYQPLTQLTDDERKYGINVYETNQPLIQVGVTSTTQTKDQAFALLKTYCQYLNNVLQATSVNATANLVSAPWIRPGMNTWFDPNGISRVYYVSSVSHSGSAQGVFTSLGLIYGRSEQEFTANYNALYPSKGGTPDAETTARLLNNFTKTRNIDSSAYYLPTTSDPLAVVTPSNIAAAKSALSQLDVLYDDTGSVVAYNSQFKNWYGKYFVRRDIQYLNRWDTEYNLLEIYGIIASAYQVKNVSNLAKSPLASYLNQTNPANSPISAFAQYAINWNLNNITVPAVITTRVKNLAKTIVTAEQEIITRYGTSPATNLFITLPTS